MDNETVGSKTITQEREGVELELEELFLQNTRLMLYHRYHAHFNCESLYAKWKAYKQYTPYEKGVLTTYFNHVIYNKMMK